jgi:mRNA-degrading endonuclease RelE of RelBE toxin-antitoxin system
MFEELMSKVTEEKNKLIDQVTRELIAKARIDLPENPSSFDYFMVQDELRKKQYRLVYEYDGGKDRICLYKIGQLNDDLMYGYYIDVRVKDKTVSIVADPINIKFAPSI